MRGHNGHLKWRVIALLIVASAMAVSPVDASAASIPESLGALRATYAPRAEVAGFPPVILGGLTSQRWPAVFFITNNETRIRLAAIGLVMSCTSGDSIVINAAMANLRITPQRHSQCKRRTSAFRGSHGFAHGRLDLVPGEAKPRANGRRSRR